MAMQLTLQPASAKKDELGTPIGLHYYDLSLSKCYSTTLRGISYNRHIFGLIIVIIMRRQLIIRRPYYPLRSVCPRGVIATRHYIVAGSSYLIIRSIHVSRLIEGRR